MTCTQEYYRLTREYIERFGEKTVVWYQVGSFYEMYAERQGDGTYEGCNLREFSRVGNLTIGPKTSKTGTSMVGFATHTIEKYIPSFQEEGYTIVIYDQELNTAPVTRRRKCIISPGTYFSQDSSKVDNNVMAVWIEPLRSRFLQGERFAIGIANVDILTGSTSMQEFVEEFMPEMHTTYNDIERALSIYRPSELIVLSRETEEDIHRMTRFFNFTPLKQHVASLKTDDVNLKTKLENCEKQIYQHDTIARCFGPIDAALATTLRARPFATQALTYLLDFVNMHNPDIIQRLGRPEIDDPSSRLVLENHSLRQLNMIDDGLNTGPFSSVLKLLNKCVTPMGQRRLERILLGPTTDRAGLSREYDITEFILGRLTDLSFLTNQLGDVKDLERLTRQLAIRKLTPASMVAVHDSLRTVGAMRAGVAGMAELEEYLACFIELDVTESVESVSVLIKGTIDLDAAREADSLAGGVNFIRRGVDAELDSLVEGLRVDNEKIAAIRAFFHRLISKTVVGARSTGDSVKLHEMDKRGLTLCATKKRCDALKAGLAKEGGASVKLAGTDCEFTLDTAHITFRSQGSKSDLSIVSPQISECLDRVWTLRQQIKDRVNLVYMRFLESTQHMCPVLKDLANFVARLDVAYTRARVAHRYNYCKPTVVAAENAFIDAEGLRHCLIEHISKDELYVTNDISLGVDGLHCNGVLLYGTNAVGKTSLIRSIGMSVIMAQAGFYVPCSSMRFSPYNHIFTRILSNDNLFQGNSTFTVELCELRRIVDNANNRSLILGDEVCSGTEINSAISIFVATLERLHRCNSSFIFATHLHMVSDYEEVNNLSNLQKKHMAVMHDAQLGKLVYDRKLREGSGSDMYGLEVCKSMALPADFMERCYGIREKYGATSSLHAQKSRYNAGKLKGMCEICKKAPAEHVHHLCYQQDAGDNGYIESFHKDHVANLVGICEPCHHEIHSNDTRMRFVKTSTGMELLQLE